MGYILDFFYSVGRLASRRDYIRDSMVHDFGLGDLELSLQANPIKHHPNGFYPVEPSFVQRDGLMYGYHSRDRERPDSHANKYEGNPQTQKPKIPKNPVFSINNGGRNKQRSTRRKLPRVKYTTIVK